MTRMIPIAIASLLIEGVLVWRSMAGMPVYAFVSVHLVLSSGLFALAWIAKRDRTSLVLLAACIAFCGPFGAVGGIVLTLMATIPGKDFATYRRALGPEADRRFATPRSIMQSSNALLSFHDVMLWGVRSEKQMALRRITERYSPAFAPALKLAMADATPEIRSEAGAAAAAILTGLQDDAKDKAGVAATGDADALMAYGDAELRVANSGLVSRHRAAAARVNALKAYAEARRAAPGKGTTTRLKTAQALFDSGAVAAAAAESGAALTEDTPSGEALALHLECLFALGRYGEIRRLLSASPAKGHLRRAVPLWQTPQPPVHAHG